ncbi:Uncharacterised protein [Vibrio cholerae]|nr:Uncharacterised protein [Vibrio cholerae]
MTSLHKACPNEAHYNALSLDHCSHVVQTPTDQHRQYASVRHFDRDKDLSVQRENGAVKTVSPDCTRLPWSDGCE